MSIPVPEPNDVDAQPRPIDLEHLRRQTFEDRTLQAELLELFARQAKTILADLASTSGVTGDARRRRADLLHTLCGSARAVGAWDVARGAEQLELEARALDGTDGAPAGMAALDRSVTRAARAIETLRAEGGGKAGPAPPARR